MVVEKVVKKKIDDDRVVDSGTFFRFILRRERLFNGDDS